MKTIMRNYLTMVAVAVLGGTITLGGYHLLVGNQQNDREIGFVQNKVPVQLTSTIDNISNLPDLTASAAIATPAVVHVKSNFLVRTRSGWGDPFGDLFGDDFFSPFRSRPRTQQAQASGSGVITSPDGYIVTNNHVIKDAESVEVVLQDGRSYVAEVIGKDPSTDLALLKVDEKKLEFLSFGNSDDLRVGEWVLAVGNPFNLTSTVTAGIVSAKARNIHILKDRMAIESFIQTDAAVNPGNSGGALVNSRGELVGINTAIASTTGAYAGYSFAVPSEIVKKVIQDLMTHGVVQRAFLGVNMVELNGDVAKELGTGVTQGVYIDEVVTGGSAEQSGIQKGDIILELAGKQLRNAAELTEYVGRHRPGDQIEVTLVRDGKKVRMPVKLVNYRGTTDVVKKQDRKVQQELGVELEDLPANLARKLNLRGGVRVLKVANGKIRQSTDIRPGFIITGIDNQAVESVTDLERILADKQGGVMMEGIYPDRPGMYYYAFGM